MRMSAGASCRKEKPRVASSSWKDETPRSKRMPSYSAAGRFRQLAEIAVDEIEARAEFLAQAGRAVRRRGVAVEGGHVDVRRGFEQGAGVAAAAEGAVEKTPPGPR
jgi:hypothetical protein